MLDEVNKTIDYTLTFDEVEAFEQHVTWCIYEQDQPVNEHLQSFIDKILYDSMPRRTKEWYAIQELEEAEKNLSPPYEDVYDEIPDRY